MISKKKKRVSSASNHKRVGVLLLVSFLVLVLIYGLTSFGLQIAGKAIFDLDANYVEGEPLEGTLSLSMKAGELVPASSKIVFETSEERYEYALEDVVSGKVIDGAFYIDGASVSGEGEGYGVEGTREVRPSVSFVLDISREKGSESSDAGGSDGDVLAENDSTEEVVVEEVGDEVVVEEVGEEVVAIEEPVVEEVVAEEPTTEEPTTEEVVVEEAVAEEPKAEEPKAKKPTDSLSITGQVSLAIKNKAKGKVSPGNSFVYNLDEGESVRVRAGSVKAGSVKLSEDVLKLDVSSGQVTVTTNYSEVEQGFGEEFSTGDDYSLDIDLDSLNLTFTQGDLKVSLVYEDTEIVSLSVLLEEGAVKGEDVVEEKPVLEVSVSVETENLTEVQIETLAKEFGNVSVKTTKSEVVGGRLVVRYELGRYWIEYSYDYEDENIRAQVEAERMSWLGDLANALAEEETAVKSVEEFSGSFDY